VLSAPIEQQLREADPRVRALRGNRKRRQPNKQKPG
jgi:hypothetical protein